VRWRKLAETTHRDVNIALANQFRNFAEGANIDIAAVTPPRTHSPIATSINLNRGGIVIPIYPSLLSGTTHFT
jgi:UDP-N-acetyl-D-mannosaminuronate dehydrogenase